MIHHFLVNPAAGKGKVTDALIRRIHRVCTARGVDYRIHITTRQGDATEYVRAVSAVQPDERHRFYACGGDGTLCEVINGAPRAANVEFGVVPIGTGNDFVRNFTDRDNFFDIDRQLGGEVHQLDMMRYNDRFALNMINVGFDCNVVKKTGEIKRSPLIPSGLAYGAGVAITLCKPFGTRFKVELEDGTVISENLLLAAVANGSCYGGGFHPAPRASLNDGLLDVAIIKKVSRARFLSLVGSYKNGTYLEKKGVENLLYYHKTKSVRMTFAGPINLCVDGEIEMTDFVEIEVVPGVLPFVLPQGSGLLSEQKAAESAAEAEVTEAAPV